MSESGEDARLQRFIERERMGLNDEAKARIRELERVVAEKNARIKELEGIVSGKTMYDAAEAERERIRAGISRIRSEVSAAFDYPQAAMIVLDSVLAVIDEEGGTVEWDTVWANGGRL